MSALTFLFLSQIEGLMDDVDFKAKVTRAEFEELCADLFERVPGPVQQALQSAEMKLVRQGHRGGRDGETDGMESEEVAGRREEVREESAEEEGDLGIDPSSTFSPCRLRLSR